MSIKQDIGDVSDQKQNDAVSNVSNQKQNDIKAMNDNTQIDDKDISTSNNITNDDNQNNNTQNDATSNSDNEMLRPPKHDQSDDFYIDDQQRKVYNITSDGLVQKIMIKSNPDGNKISGHILGRVWLNIKGRTADGDIFIDSLFEEIDLILGKADYTKGIDQALVTMKHNECAIIKIYDVEKYGYSKLNRPDKCPENNDDKSKLPLIFNVFTMDSFPKEKESQDMTIYEQLNHSNLLRESGNIRYKKKRFKTALKFYKRCESCLDAMNDTDMSMPKELEKISKKGITSKDVNQNKIKCYLNIAICERRLSNYNECIKYASKAIDVDKCCKKGYIRRGLSYFDQCNYNLAKRDFIKYKKLTSNNKKESEFVEDYLLKIGKAKKIEKKKERKIYGGFLNKKKFSLYDDKDKNDKNLKNNDYGFWWNLIYFIPNSVSYAFNECTKYCRKSHAQ